MRLTQRTLFFRVARICAMFFIGLVVSLAIALSQVDLETLRGQITTTLSHVTGMPVEIRGNIKWKFSLTPRIALSDVVIKSQDWAKNTDGIKIDTVVAKLDLLSLLGKTAAISDVILINPVINLEENDKGQYSLESTRFAATESDGDTPTKFPFDTDWGIDSIRMQNAKFTFLSHGEKSEFISDDILLRYKKTNDFIEYGGHFALDGQEYSFIASLSVLDATRKVYPVRVAVANKLTPIVANIALEQTSKLPIDFIVKGKIADIQMLAKYLHSDFPKIAPMTINLSGGMGYDNVTLHQSAISFGKSDLSVSGTYSWNGEKPKIKGKLKSKKFILGEVFPELYGSAKTPWKRPNRDLNVFKDTPLYSDYLRLADADVSIDFANINVYRNLSIEEINAKAVLEDGQLSLSTDAKFAGGSVKAAVSAYDDGGVLYAKGAGRGSNIVTGRIMSAVGEGNVIKELPANFEFYLQAEGRDLSGLMSSVTGPVYIYSVGGGTALPDVAEYVYGSDFLTSIRHSVQDFVTNKDKYDKVTISCAAINLKLRNGIVETERGVALETNTVNMRLAGSVDLGKEIINASLVSTPVRGLKLSISGSIVNSMEFSGNMAEPDFKIDGGNLVGRTATTAGIGMILLAPFTGGLSLVAGAGVGFLAGDLLTNWLADDHPCRTALEKGAPARDDDAEFINRPLSELVKEMGI